MKNENVLEIIGLCKKYPKFTLDSVSFSVKEGEIMGFIGRNGAGKTTTIKSVLGLVNPDGGEVRFFGRRMCEDESEIKQQIGYACGSIGYYPRRRLCDTVAVTRRFYGNFDETLYKKYLSDFSIDESKRPIELSEGMKVKFNLALALSHHAKLLILDEPTSGLDPVSREELLEIFLSLAHDGVSILFSTHITSDLVKCADSVTYIKGGRVEASMPIGEYTDGYRLVRFDAEPSEDEKRVLHGICRSRDGFTGLVRACDAESFSGKPLVQPTLEEVMVHLEMR